MLSARVGYVSLWDTSGLTSFDLFRSAGEGDPVLSLSLKDAIFTTGSDCDKLLMRKFNQEKEKSTMLFYELMS